ncbi:MULTISPECIES: hypothetical protein [unclassified Streptomyces]|uniref:hypothetical protein n=1 Tax=unclassified Streptomyces TaxID=2593676 RepID=UPI0022517692|nr:MULTISPECIES: hypothetical protein [unclassified Streptomyces]MCX5336441.1 hypothetical protein [Streptomyces sp. NBC_00140]MCX5367167.1 hypothetical protein [Streptomyces sp. NBC_00124]
MTGKQVMTVLVLAAVLAWSTVMTVLGQLTALIALLPTLGLLIQQIVSALSGPDTRATTAAAAPAAVPAPAPAAGPAGSQEPPQ